MGPKLAFVAGICFSLTIFTGILSAGQSLAEAPANDPIKIGTILSLSGWASDGGESELGGMRLAIQDINAGGGIKGQPLKLVIEDNRSDFAATVTAFNKLTSIDQIPVLVGPNWAEFSDVVAPLAQSRKIAMITPSGYTATLTKGRDFVFSLSQDDYLRTTPIADAIVSGRPSSVFTLNSAAAYCEGITNAVKLHLKKANIPVVGSELVNPGSTDFRTIIAKIRSSRAQAVFVAVVEGADLPSFLRQYREGRMSASLYSDDLLFDPTIRKQPDLAEGVIFQRYASQAPEHFIRRFKEISKSDPSTSSERAYDAIGLVKQSIENCGYSGPAVRDCLKKQTGTGLSGDLAFNAENIRRSQKPETQLYTVFQGAFKKLE